MSTVHSARPSNAQALDHAAGLIERLDLDRARPLLEDYLRNGGNDRKRARFMLAAVLLQEGLAGEACTLLRELVLAYPRRREFWATWLTALKTAHGNVDEFVNAHRCFAAQFLGEESTPPRARRKDARTLHVGFTGADGHAAIMRFLAFLEHSHHRVTLFVRNPACAARLAVDRPELACVMLPPCPESACEAVRRREIDVLVDLCGHGPGGALEMIARGPAPVTATWLDYLATTGLPAVHHRITDWIADPPGNERLHSESLARLPFAAWCYSPYREAPAPRRRKGALTVGSACIPLKMTASTLALWRRTLEALPGARFVLMGFMSQESRRRVLHALGPDVADRTSLLGRLPIASYLEAVNSLDVALDTVGFSGGTSTFDCLWQGVPVVTLPGLLSHSRSSASLLAHAGLESCVAGCPDGFVDRALALADARHADRASMRDRLRATPLANARLFAVGFDELVSSLWPTSEEAPDVEVKLQAALRSPLESAPRRAAFEALAALAAC